MTTPTLDDDRIERMRASIMYTVDQDQWRRRRRTRRATGLVAASVLVVGFGAVGIQVLGSRPIATDNSLTSQRESAPDAGGAQLDSRYSGGDELAAPDADRQVITTGSVSVTVTKPRSSAGQLSAYVESLGGRVDSRTEDGSGDDASASLQVRVPSTKVQTMIKQLGSYGTVSNVSLQNEDVTSVSKDLDARIDALQISVDRLQSILAEADTSREVISAEGALTERQEQLESLQSQKRSLAGQVELSSISVDFAQKTRVDTVEPGGFTGGLRDGWNALVSTVNHVVELIGVLLPWAAIVALILLPVVLVRRRKHWN